MRAKTSVSDPQMRQRIAQLSARLMVQEGIDDYQMAKCKAAAQLGVPNTRHLPSNSEIEAEVIIYQRLFQSESHTTRLCHLRQTALQAMQLLIDFNPRLVGTVLNGTAHQYSAVTLHVFTDTPEEIAFFLMERNIPYQLGQQRFRLPELTIYPSYQFLAGKITMVLVVFQVNDIRWSPPSPVDGKPMRRADIRTLEDLLKTTA